ncbi:(2,3-dihydroxybenzoyl)adenylate synthase [Poseidonocella sedimentorum]|uniref:2,3-dihydroxybenzoate-AMP ligase n=1 Tax=Poseidonocella sedimentorum TaxID=871652 RepID=A0A1I6E4N3_9RHOB|nr:AMP-binding protein [Poseidonocella sedimentorum]SFR12511.1 2,3-dihydroxybenzoate-AMP ligase [Poseidonocella sedimentorum]
MPDPTQTCPQQLWPAPCAARYRARGYWRGVSFGGWLDEIAAAHGPREALVAGTLRLSYDELRNLARAYAAGFLGDGFAPGDRVLVQLPNGPAFLPVVLGLLYAGLVPVYALPAHRDREIAHLVAGSGARALICAESYEGFDYRPLAEAVRAACPSLTRIYIDGAPQAGMSRLADLADTAPLDAPVPRDPGSVAFLQISGGTTGFPKLIPRTHDDYIYSFEASAGICAVTPRSVLLTALPAAHNFPMSSPGYFGALSVGAKVVMSPSPAPGAAFPLIAAEGVTHTGLVPPLALLWMQAAKAAKHDLNSLEVLLVGGAKFTPEAAAQVRPTLGCQLQQVFGMAEGLVNYTRLDDPEEVILNTQGRPISPDDEILLLDEDGAPATGGHGVLHTRGPYTIRAYHNAPEANARAFTPEGFYCTGDIVRLRPDGNLEVQGRAGDHINRAGEKVSAEEIEDNLIAHEAVFDAVVVSVPDRFLGERSCAFVVLHDGAKAEDRALKAFIRGRGIAEFKVPDQIVFTDRFETTAVGKTDRKALRAALKKRHFA